MSVSDGSSMISLGTRLRPMGGEMQSTLRLAALVEIPTGARKGERREGGKAKRLRAGFGFQGGWRVVVFGWESRLAGSRQRQMGESDG